MRDQFDTEKIHETPRREMNPVQEEEGTKQVYKWINMNAKGQPIKHIHTTSGWWMTTRDYYN